MKKLISTSTLLLLLASCGGPENGNESSDGVELTEHRIFITSSTTNGIMVGGTGATGLEKADSICTSLAKAAGLTRSYKAILSDSTAHASNRLVITGAIYVIDGSSNKNEIADSAAALWNAESVPLKNTIDYNENEAYITNKEVWSGTEAGGTLGLKSCDKWDDVAETADYGSNSDKDGNWIETTSTASCSTSKHLYCISQ